MFGASAHITEPAMNRLKDSDDHDTPAIDVAQRPEHRRHGHRCQEIRGDDPGQAGDLVELTPDGRKRGGDDGLVERRQEHGEQEVHQDGAHFGLRQAGSSARARAHPRSPSPAPAVRTARPRCHPAMREGRQLMAPPVVSVHVQVIL